MSVFVALTVGLVFWIVAWAFGVKAFDAFLVTIAITVGAAAFKIYQPLLEKMLGREAPEPEQDLGL